MTNSINQFKVGNPLKIDEDVKNKDIKAIYQAYNSLIDRIVEDDKVKQELENEKKK